MAVSNSGVYNVVRRAIKTNEIFNLSPKPQLRRNKAKTKASATNLKAMAKTAAFKTNAKNDLEVNAKDVHLWKL